ncbi:MAG: hypothetical protein FWD34_06425 [Oscillospiraceae bacterium]|nr:hypothetical protein [Oscillospiraceae bacterium]
MKKRFNTIILVIAILGFTVLAVASVEDDISSNDNINSGIANVVSALDSVVDEATQTQPEQIETNEYVNPIKEIKVLEEDGDIIYDILINDSFDWYNHSLSTQREFAQRCIMLCQELVIQAGHNELDVYISGFSENWNLFFNFDYSNNIINIWTEKGADIPNDKWRWDNSITSHDLELPDGFINVG